MNFKRVELIGILLAIAIAIFAFIVSMVLHLPYSDAVATAALGYAILAFIGIWYTLYATLAQLRRAMAKPELKLFFGKDDNEFGENDKTSIEVNVDKEKYKEVQLYLWIKNIGNSVAKTFQIEIEVPIIFEPTDFNTKRGKLPSKFIDNENFRIYTLYSTDKICFVNKPEYIGDSIILGMNSKKYDEYKNEYGIHYRVFGDWAETQGDKLKVIIRK